jgi:hypothetical protein
MLNNIKIIEGEMKCGARWKKRTNIKLGASEGLEKILLEWFQWLRSESEPISRSILRRKATDIALCLKISQF